MRQILVWSATLAVAWPSALLAETAACNVYFDLYTINRTTLPGSSARIDPKCSFNTYSCDKPKFLGSFLRKVNTSCNPVTQFCAVELVANFEYPGNHENSFTLSKPRVFWYAQQSPTPNCLPPGCNEIGVCGEDLSYFGNFDFVETALRTNARCDALGTYQHCVYSIKTYACMHISGCRNPLEVPGLDITASRLGAFLDCPRRPRTDSCESCGTCKRGVGEALQESWWVVS